MKKKPQLPEGFRIISYCVTPGDDDDPYDWGEWTYALQQWKTWTRGILKKREVSGWKIIEFNTDDRLLLQTAQIIAKGNKA